MARTLWTPTIAWIGAVAGALMLAVASPSENSMMGRLPSPAAQRIVHVGQLPADRVLALVGFERSQRGEIKSWVQGLQLCQEQAIPWIRMAILKDPGNDEGRRAVERRLQDAHGTREGGPRVVPVFTDRDRFIREAGLTGRDHASVLVLSRDGQVLAKAEGEYDAARATALRETLLAPEASVLPSSLSTVR
jgi:hypothetical protein